MLRTVGLILVFILPLVSSADARIEVDGNFCHVPYDAANADNENYLSGCGGIVRAYAGGARASGIALLEKSNVPYSLLPIEYDGIPDSGIFIFELTSDVSTTPCTLVDSNGTNYVAESWSSRITVTRTQSIYRATALYGVECWGGVAQAE